MVEVQVKEASHKHGSATVYEGQRLDKHPVFAESSTSVSLNPGPVV